ncbi:MAG: phage holin family protein [Methanobrevibacter sp.]|nr:phage holin family protein [Methanobrevibacter sp.]
MSDAYIEDKQQVTSEKMWKGLAKKISKLLLPLIVVLVLKGIGFENLEMVVTTIFSILIITEGYSIIGHIYSINT